MTIARPHSTPLSADSTVTTQRSSRSLIISFVSSNYALRQYYSATA
jgi:hypothetical protein